MQKIILLLLAFAGLAHAATYSSLQEALTGLPELSLLKDNMNIVSGLPVANKVEDPDFVGTLFAPTNAYLKNLTTELGGDLTQLEMDQSAINNVLSMSVVDGKAYTLADLIALDGQKLTTLDGSLASVTVKQGSAGPVVYINESPIMAANIRAGKAMIMEMGGIILPAEYQALAYSLAPPLSPAATVDLSQANNGSTTPIPTLDNTPETSSGTDVSDTPESATTTELKNAAGHLVMSAAILAVPALLAILL